MQQKIYRLPPAVKGVMAQALACSLLMALAVTVLALLAPPRDKSQLPAMLGLLAAGYGGSIFFWRALCSCDTHLEVGDEEISQHWPRKPTIHLRWEEISQVKNNPIMQRLELRSKVKGTKITVEHQIEDFTQLKQFIESKISI